MRIRKDEISPRVSSGANNSDGAANHADLCSNVLGSDVAGGGEEEDVGKHID